MNRPEPPSSIKLFAMAFMAQAIGSVVHIILAPADLQSRLDATFRPGDWAAAMFVLVLAFRLGIASLLSWFVYVRANNFAKWLAVLLVVGRLAQAGEVAWAGLWQGNPNSIAWFVTSVVAVFAVVCLFLPDSQYWFTSKGRSTMGDGAVFE